MLVKSATIPATAVVVVLQLPLRLVAGSLQDEVPPVRHKLQQQVCLEDVDHGREGWSHEAAHPEHRRAQHVHRNPIHPWTEDSNLPLNKAIASQEQYVEGEREGQADETEPIPSGREEGDPVVHGDDQPSEHGSGEGVIIRSPSCHKMGQGVAHHYYQHHRVHDSREQGLDQLHSVEVQSTPSCIIKLRMFEGILVTDIAIEHTNADDRDSQDDVV
mmetsp:Transcript_47504/g.152548  ORF Transcript_47504/g.152548 Transcript_47504/m.152548 type:complete len:216 (+) Transcript_47504:1746-2393(+)